MFENISLINFLIYAMAFGFAAAIIYTNIQRTALSRFINALIEKGCESESTSLTLSELGLSGVYAAIARSAVKKQFGLRKSISVVESGADKKDSLEKMLDGCSSENKYFLSQDCDKELLLKRYNYETISAKYILLFLLALLAIIIAAVFAVNMIIDNLSKKSASDSDETTQQATQELSEDISEQDEFSETEADEEISDDASDEDENSSATPSLPVSY